MDDKGQEDIKMGIMRQFKKFPITPLVVIFGCLGAFVSYALSNPNQVGTEAKVIVMLMALVSLLMYLFLAVPPVSQDLGYHNFADKRCLCCGVPNTLDVASNIPFAIVGLVALSLQLTGHFVIDGRREVQIAWGFLWVSIIAIGFGSAYYHWAPTNATLVWDRLPMTFAFTGLTALLMQENAGVGLISLPILVGIGVWSVWYWAKTDDLRPYFFVQGFPMLTLPFFLYLFPSKYDQRDYYLFALAWYAIARVTEVNDRKIFTMSGRLFSGHTLKHLAAAVALCMIPRMLSLRKEQE
uniref:Alkaline phytoceramidase n=1 Tax=Lotharella globosa TaxID=91324 RepID=A0A7S3ZI92_9EUKA